MFEYDEGERRKKKGGWCTFFPFLLRSYNVADPAIPPPIMMTSNCEDHKKMGKIHAVLLLQTTSRTKKYVWFGLHHILRQTDSPAPCCDSLFAARCGQASLSMQGAEASSLNDKNFEVASQVFFFFFLGLHMALDGAFCILLICTGNSRNNSNCEPSFHRIREIHQ
jgi:hypothetical protein